MHFELSPLIVWVALWIVNTCSEFQVNIFSIDRDITKCQNVSAAPWNKQQIIALTLTEGEILMKPEPFPKRQFLDASKLKEFADDSFKFDENCRKFSKWIENSVGKSEIARYE